MQFFQILGFTHHPFAHTNADEEPDLDKYFVRPKFFDAMIGDPERPVSSVVFAPRGGGKTAQRRMIENISQSQNFLAITYDRFDEITKPRSLEAARDTHLEAIIARVFVSYLTALAALPAAVDSLSNSDRELIASFAAKYLKNMTGSQLRDLLREVRSLSVAAKDFWETNTTLIEPILGFVGKWLGLPKLKFPRSTKKGLELGPHKSQLEALYGLVRKVGFKSIYVLIDKVDETPASNNDAKATYQIVKPLLVDLELLGLKGYCFKFFLWDAAEQYYRDGDARPDRITIYKLTWDRKLLQNLLAERLRAYSNGQHASFASVAPDVTTPDELMALLANQSPRSLISIGNSILAAQAESDPNSKVVVEAAFDAGVIDYCDKHVRDSYGQHGPLREILKVGQEVFTTNHCATNVFKISVNGAREKIQSWTRAGLVVEAGTVKVLTSNKPVNVYCIVDPCVVRLIHRVRPLKEVARNRWHVCSKCGKDNFFDASTVLDFEPSCINCQQPLR
jgi:hypothetical protein